MFEAHRAEGSRYPATVTLKRVDVAKVDEVDAWINEVIQDHGRLDGAANVAGMAGGEGQLTEDVVRFDDFFGPLTYLLTLHSPGPEKLGENDRGQPYGGNELHENPATEDLEAGRLHRERVQHIGPPGPG